MTYYKSDLYLVPRAKEKEYRTKFDTYQHKIGKFRTDATRIKYVIEGDQAAILGMDQGEEDNSYENQVNEATQKVVNQAKDTQDKSK